MTHASRISAWLLLVAACGNPSNDGTSTDSGSVGTGYEGTEDTGKPDLVCIPGQTQCGDETTLEVCDETGLGWEAQPCSNYSTCIACEDGDETCTAECRGPCNSEDELPSSAGCSFLATRMIHVYEDVADGLIVGNPNSDATATVTFFEIADGKREEEVVDIVELPPGTSHDFLLDINFIDIEGYSRFRTGGVYRLQSDIPVVAYQHSPYTANRANDASMLLPESALRSDYVVASYPPFDNDTFGYPSYFTVIALEDDTELRWTPPIPTAGSGFPIDPVAAGKTGKLAMNRFDTARIAASSAFTSVWTERDISGTVVHANKPIWVVGATKGARVPANKPGTDHLQEMMLPLDYWGDAYVAAPSPKRANERHYWRVYAGAKDGVTVTADPPVIEPIVLDKRGKWFEFSVPNGTAFVLEGDGPFMPVQYLASDYVAGKIGDPSMYQMVATDQFLGRYVFVTGKGYALNYVQVIRHAGGGDVTVDGEVVMGYYKVGDFEVADWAIAEGAHTATSDEDFGIIQIGYTIGSGEDARASYAYPGGMKVEPIYIP